MTKFFYGFSIQLFVLYLTVVRFNQNLLSLIGARKMRKKRNLKEKILQKSVDLFYKHGFTHASIRDIVKAAGISNSTVYIYYKNKADILFNIILGVGEELLRALQIVVEQHADRDDAIQCLRAMIFQQICFSLEKCKYKEVKIYLEEQFRLPPHLRKKTYEQHRQIYDLYYSKICEIKENGLLNRKVDKVVITFGIFAMMNWVYRWFDSGGRLSIEDVAENVVDMFFSGVLENGAGKGEASYSSNP